MDGDKRKRDFSLNTFLCLKHVKVLSMKKNKCWLFLSEIVKRKTVATIILMITPIPAPNVKCNIF